MLPVETGLLKTKNQQVSETFGTETSGSGTDRPKTALTGDYRQK
jgi:hypothetical protein